MKIAESDVALTGRSSYAKETATVETLNFSAPPAQENGMVITLDTDILSVTENARKLLSAERRLTGTDGTGGMFELSEQDRQKLDLIDRFFRQMTGKTLKFAMPQKINFRRMDGGGGARTIAFGTPMQGAGPGFTYSRTTTVSESQSLDFHAVASVRTEDGREYNVDLSMMMSRTYSFAEQVTLRAGGGSGGGAMTDPLVINFRAAGASLSQQKYEFDLDADGDPDRISFAGEGSGFLAYDADSDGVINNGSELFGTQSGNGFADLAAHDSDQNGWIDENDPIYDSLQIWVREKDGSDRLFALGEKGIGAICLGNVGADFLLKNGANQTDGRIRRTGIFLREDGSAGTLQHVDIAI